MAEQKDHGIGLLTCLSLVTATMVGTGVYTSLGFQLVDLESGFSILLLWILGGVIALCGALSYAELVVAIPRSGGEYTYLSEIYHPALGFMAAFVSLLAGFAAPISLAAMAFGSYLHAALPGCPAKLSSFLAVTLISLGHLFSIRLSALLQNGVTTLKFLILTIFLSIGLWKAVHHPECLTILKPTLGSLTELFHPSAGIALIFVLYAYSGWNASTYLAGEVKNAQRTVGLSLVIGTALVTLLYMVINAVFLTSAPVSELRNVLNVGSISATHLLGVMGGQMMSGVIALGLLACLSAMILAGPRVTQRVGEDYHFFAELARLSTHGLPVRATLLQLLLVLVLIATGSFASVLVYAQTPLLLCLVLSVAGVFILRSRGAPTGFRCPIFPLPPLLFIFCTLATLLYSACSKPWVALAGFGTMLVPLLAHPWIAAKNSRLP